MRIKEITWQHRRDFEAIMECEHCGEERVEKHGYDDTFYHKNVIPKMECEKCGKVAPDSYEPQATKYPDGFQI